MITKEEIEKEMYESTLSNLGNPYPFEDDEAVIKHCANIAHTLLSQAMRDEAVGFAKFISNNDWTSSNGINYMRYEGTARDLIVKPAVELYTEYLQHKQQTNK